MNREIQKLAVEYSIISQVLPNETKIWITKISLYIGTLKTFNVQYYKTSGLILQIGTYMNGMHAFFLLNLPFVLQFYHWWVYR